MMRSFREETQLTLRELASLLDVSHNLIAMDEKGLRFLPPAAEKKLELLQDVWREVQKNKGRRVVPLPETLMGAASAIAKEIQTTTARAEKKLEHLAYKLELLRERYQFLQQRLAFLQEARARIKAADILAVPLELLAKRAAVGMKACSPAVQQRLETERRILAFKYKELTRLASRFSAPTNKDKGL